MAPDLTSRDAHAGDARGVAEHLVERVVPQDAHVAARRRVFAISRSTRIASARNLSRRWTTVTVARDVGQVQRLLDGRVAAADDDDVLALVEEAVAGRAGRHALAHERLLGRQAEVARRRAGGDDQRVAGVFAAVADQPDRPLARASTVWMWSKIISVSKRSACFWNRAIRSGPMTPSASAGQLSTSVVVISWPPCARPVISTGLEVGACGVYCRRVAGGAGTEDQQAGVLGGHGILVGAKRVRFKREMGVAAPPPQAAGSRASRDMRSRTPPRRIGV